MFKLIKNELEKIFRKKGIYIVLIVFLALLLFVTVLEKNLSQVYTFDTGIDQSIQIQKEELKNFDTSTVEAKQKYCDIKTNIDLLELQKKYKEEQWKVEVIYSELLSIISNLNYYEMGIGENIVNIKSKQELQNEYNSIINMLDTNDWKSFVKQELKDLKQELLEMEEALKQLVDEEQKNELNKSIEKCKISIQINEWRLEKNISLGDVKYNPTLFIYQSNAEFLIDQKYQGINEKNYVEKESLQFDYNRQRQYQSSLEEFNISKYKIENDIPIDSNGISYELENLFSGIGLLFIIIIGVMVAGTIVSDEFNKGTIKLLLIRPYSRKKILFSKIIACLIAIIFAIIAIILIDTFVTGISYGFETANIPIVKYNFNTNKVIQMNPYIWVITNLLCLSPIIIILSSIALMIGTIFTNSTTAITLTILLYMATNIIKEIVAMSAKIKWAKYVPLFNWDLTEVLYGSLSTIKGATMGVSVITCIITVVVILVITFENFANKNIKNI